MTTTIRMTEAVPSGAVNPLKSVRLRGDCLKVDPVCRQRAALSSLEPAIGQTRQVPLPGNCQAGGNGGKGLRGLDAEAVEQGGRVGVDLDGLQEIRDDRRSLEAVAGDEQHDLVVAAEVAAGDRAAKRPER